MVVRTLKLYSHGNFQVYNTALLTRVIMLYVKFLELINLLTESLCLLTMSRILPSNHHSILHFYGFHVFRLHI